LIKIKYENVVKQFPGSDHLAVDNLNMEVHEGEICILVGPSGCGKTTSMKMTNRIFEHTSGHIYIDGIDNRDINPIQLRLGIGYVIQEIGLFPHMSIADNVATVLVEKKWPKNKIRQRVDEMLNLVGLDPKIYSHRRPSGLSGGQRQRVGVARALASDPPVMLMDEPFGAVDPITRARLQNEFLRLQEQMKKTIIFVTHDIDEAIKMGDRIAVMRHGQLVQYATPDDLLSMPANEFVSSLVGGNRSIKRLNLIRVEDIERYSPPAVAEGDSKIKVAEAVEDSKLGVALVVDDQGKLIGTVTSTDLKRNGDYVKDIYSEAHDLVGLESTLRDTLSIMLGYGEGYALAVDQDGKPRGAVSVDDIFSAVKDNE